jgi:dephospho-CoA kinase
MPRPLKVALTGGIATGKSYCLAGFAERGVPTIDADVLARTVVRRGEPAWEAVRLRFGDSVMQADADIDRARLGALIFADPAARRDLEQIVHPAVYRAIRSWYETLPAGSGRIAVADIPLLFETGNEKEFDRVVATWCPEEVQISRLAKRNEMTEVEARQRIRAQMPVGEKARRAHYVIRTNGTYEETNRQIDEIVAALTGPPTKPEA